MTSRDDFDPCVKPYSNVKFEALSESGFEVKVQGQIQGYRAVTSDDLDNFYESNFSDISLSWDTRYIDFIPGVKPF